MCLVESKRWWWKKKKAIIHLAHHEAALTGTETLDVYAGTDVTLRSEQTKRWRYCQSKACPDQRVYREFARKPGEPVRLRQDASKLMSQMDKQKQEGA